ncbi:MAG: adenylosuccinate lyase [Thermodesulfobacteriota bacterium]
MPTSMLDSKIFADWFGAKEMREIFTDEYRIQCWLDVEAALARIQAKLGMIPREAAEEISAKAQVVNLNLEEFKREADRTVHPLMPLLWGLQRVCQKDYGEYIHWGATTQDIMDTGMMLQIKAASQIVFRDLADIAQILKNLAQKHRSTLMAGRTHGQHALPLTFGFKVAVWLAEVRRHLQRWEQARPRILVGNLSGAVGTHAAMGALGLKVQKGVMDELGLGTPEITWHPARDRLAEFVALLAAICATLGKIAKEIINLQKTEVGELAEPFALGKIGSSTMPQKRNPHLCEAVLAISKMVRYQAALAWEAMVQEHERDMASWMVEWGMLPQVCIFTSGVLKHIKFILENLEINEKRMRINLNILAGLIMAEPVMFALAEKIGHHAAHRIIYEIAIKAHTENLTFKDALLGDERVAKYLSAERIDQLLNPEKYTGLCAELIDEIIREEIKI